MLQHRDKREQEGPALEFLRPLSSLTSERCLSDHLVDSKITPPIKGGCPGPAKNEPPHVDRCTQGRSDAPWTSALATGMGLHGGLWISFWGLLNVPFWVLVEVQAPVTLTVNLET